MSKATEVPGRLDSPLSEGLGMPTRLLERWLLTVEAARGRMAGGWVPVDAEVVLAADAALQRKQEIA